MNDYDCVIFTTAALASSPLLFVQSAGHANGFLAEKSVRTLSASDIQRFAGAGWRVLDCSGGLARASEIRATRRWRSASKVDLRRRRQRADRHLWDSSTGVNLPFGLRSPPRRETVLTQSHQHYGKHNHAQRAHSTGDNLHRPCQRC